MADLPTIMRGLDDKYAQQARLRADLDKSLLIQATWPDAFEHGSVKLGGRAMTSAPHLGTITLTKGDGSKHEFAAMTVPFELWPLTMQANYMNLPAHRRAAISHRIKRTVK